MTSGGFYQIDKLLRLDFLLDVLFEFILRSPASTSSIIEIGIRTRVWLMDFEFRQKLVNLQSKRGWSYMSSAGLLRYY